MPAHDRGNVDDRGRLDDPERVYIVEDGEPRLHEDLVEGYFRGEIEPDDMEGRFPDTRVDEHSPNTSPFTMEMEIYILAYAVEGMRPYRCPCCGLRYKTTQEARGCCSPQYETPVSIRGSEHHRRYLEEGQRQEVIRLARLGWPMADVTRAMEMGKSELQGTYYSARDRHREELGLSSHEYEMWRLLNVDPECPSAPAFYEKYRISQGVELRVKRGWSPMDIAKNYLGQSNGVLRGWARTCYDRAKSALKEEDENSSDTA